MRNRRTNRVVSLTMLAVATSVAAPPGSSASPAVIVSTSGEFSRAVASLDGGEIRLAPGDYDPVVITADSRSAEPIRIGPLVAGERPVLQGPVEIIGSSNVTLESVDVVVSNDEVSRGVVIQGSTNVTLRDVHVTGSLATAGEGAGYYAGQGIRVNDSSDVHIDGVVLTSLNNGITAGRVTDLLVEDSELSHIRRDGIVLRDLRYVTIRRNFVHSFFPKSGEDHADMIQFVARDDTEFGITDLVVTGNIFSQGSGRFTQSLFGGIEIDDSERAEEVEWGRWVISNNLIFNRHAIGIVVADLRDSFIAHNTLVPSPDSDSSVSPFDGPRIRVPSASREAYGNSIHSNLLTGEEGSYFHTTEYEDDEVGVNTFLDLDPDAPRYFERLFNALYEGWSLEPQSRPDVSRSPDFGFVPASHGYRDPIALGAGPFVDMAGSIFLEDVEVIASLGITRGCDDPGNTRFCPEELVSRGQMAAFLARALDLAPTEGQPFIDIADSTFAGEIAAGAAAGIIRGCDPPANTRFCPEDPVTRGQMAAFLNRALDGADGSEGVTFLDTADSLFADDISAIANLGITRGCDPPANTRFCPDEFVSRGQMGAFLARSLPLLDGGDG